MPPDYSGQNLRGRSFKGQDLTGANFSGADIRGTDFTNAILKRANFTGAKAGLQKRWTFGLITVSLLLSALSGCLSSILGFVQVFIFSSEVFKPEYNFNSDELLILVIISLIWGLFFCVITICKGLTAGLGAFAIAGAFTVFIAIIIAAGSGYTGVYIFLFIISFALAGAIPGVFAGAFATALAIAAGKVVTVVAIAITILITLVGLALVIGFAITQVKIAIAGISGGVLVVAFALLSVYIGWRGLAGNEKEGWVSSFAIALATTGGTSFRCTDLTDANFTDAILRNTDFRKANLTHTRFYEAKKLNLARVGDSILAKRNILKLLVTGNGRSKSYLGANLKGANLKGADLKEANLKDADISEATFQGACLEWANLTLAQAVGTDFTKALMTGACVEAWNIESTTKLDNVDCRFIYLLEHPKPGTDDRERRPSSGEFQPGEFTKLFEEVVNTVDLIFRNGIDWKAFVAAFKKVQVQNENTELAIQSIENKGDGVVVVKVAASVDADKEKIHNDFTQNYQLALQAVEEKYKAQLQAKDEQIVIYRQQSADMKEIIGLLANKPINVQVDNTVENKNMANGNDLSRKVEIGSIGGDFNNSGTINLGEISGTVTNTINQLPPSSEPDKPGIKELLEELKAVIEADKDLAEEDKAEALEQVQALAEAGKNPQEGAMQKAAKTAMKIIKGTIASLPTTATLVEAGSKLLPLISKFLGLG
ncbi:hypothetical protein BCD64_14555 [Nostoc sp. MBR 210]|nr:hypothetical protein BCD64_14555 [Nostoc sp. MBR 210]